jgi:hypothetical protein
MVERWRHLDGPHSRAMTWWVEFQLSSQFLSPEAVRRRPGQEQLRPGAARLSLRPMQAEPMAALFKHIEL